MNKSKATMQENIRYWVGVDWSQESHAIAVVDEQCTVVNQFTVDATFKGLQELAGYLHALNQVAGIAIESTVNPVMIFLQREGFTVYPINPKMSMHWRASNSVAAVKTDLGDGLVLAMELVARHQKLRALKEPAPAVAQLAGLCEKVRALVHQQTASVQRLKATLRQYYPAALDFFTDWTSPAAWRFLKKFPRPEALARARKDTLLRFLKANRIGLHPRWLERIAQRGHATQWPRPGDATALEMMAVATVAQLLAIHPHICRGDKLIAECAKELPEAAVLRSLPGAGKRLAPALTAMVCLTATEDKPLEALRNLSGVAPVPDKSGKRSQIHMRSRCNKHWRNILHLFAFCSTSSCGWARAFYELCCERGDRHATALRKLADKWLRIILRMVETGEPYNDARYVDALRSSASPVYQKLCQQLCG